LNYHLTSSYIFDMYGDEQGFLDAKSFGNLLRFINHKSQKQNVKVQKLRLEGQHVITLVSKRDIYEGEELFFDYGKDFFKDPEIQASTTRGARKRGARDAPRDIPGADPNKRVRR